MRGLQRSGTRRIEERGFGDSTVGDSGIREAHFVCVSSLCGILFAFLCVEHSSCVVCTLTQLLCNVNWGVLNECSPSSPWYSVGVCSPSSPWSFVCAITYLLCECACRITLHKRRLTCDPPLRAPTHACHAACVTCVVALCVCVCVCVCVCSGYTPHACRITCCHTLVMCVRI